jgi:hypothetical protein
LHGEKRCSNQANNCVCARRLCVRRYRMCVSCYIDITHLRSSAQLQGCQQVLV